MSGCDYNSYYNPVSREDSCAGLLMCLLGRVASPLGVLNSLSSLTCAFSLSRTFATQMFLRGLPHLCDRMRRLTSKDMAKRKGENSEEAPPDLYAISREHPLPDGNDPDAAKNSSATRQLLSSASAAKTTNPVFTGIPEDDEDLAELAAIEKRKMEILRRIEAKARGAVPPPASAPTMPSQSNDRNSQIQALLQVLGQRGQAPQQQPAPQAPPQTSNFSAIMPQLLQFANSQSNGVTSLNDLLRNMSPNPPAQPMAAPAPSQAPMNTIAQLTAALANSQERQQPNPVASAVLFNNSNNNALNANGNSNNNNNNMSSNNNNSQDVSKLLLSLMNAQRPS